MLTLKKSIILVWIFSFLNYSVYSSTAYGNPVLKGGYYIGKGLYYTGQTLFAIIGGTVGTVIGIGLGVQDSFQKTFFEPIYDKDGNRDLTRILPQNLNLCNDLGGGGDSDSDFGSGSKSSSKAKSRFSLKRAPKVWGFKAFNLTQDPGKAIGCGVGYPVAILTKGGVIMTGYILHKVGDMLYAVAGARNGSPRNEPKSSDSCTVESIQSIPFGSLNRTVSNVSDVTENFGVSVGDEYSRTRSRSSSLLLRSTSSSSLSETPFP